MGEGPTNSGEKLGPALALALALFLPAFGTHGLNATVQNIGSSLGLAEGQGTGHGLVLAAFPLAALPGYLFAGPRSDRGRRRPLVLGGIAGYALVHAGLVGLEPLSELLAVPGLWLFIALRLLAGFFGGVVFVATNALVADLYPPHRRGRAMSLVWMGIPAALVVGVPLTAYLTPWVAGLEPGYQRWLGQPYALIALVVSVGAALAVSRAVQEPQPERAEPADEGLEESAPSATFRLAPLVALLMPMAVFGLLATVSEQTRQEFAWGEVERGNLFLVLGLTGIAGGFLSSLVADRLGKLRCLLLAQVSFAVLVLLLPVSGAAAFLVVAGALSLLSTMRQGPFQALAAGTVPRVQRGKLSALILGAGAVGTSAGQIVGSALMGRGGFLAVAGISAGVMLVAVAISMQLWRGRRLAEKMPA